MGERAYYLGWLLCFKLSWSSYHNLGESNPTNILFVPKYKSQSRLVLCSKHSQRDARVRISKEIKSTPCSPTIYTTVFTQQRSIEWKIRLFISQMENGDCIIYGSEGRINQHSLNIWFAPIVHGEALFHLTMVNSSALSFHNLMWRKLNFILGALANITMTLSQHRIQRR